MKLSERLFSLEKHKALVPVPRASSFACDSVIIDRRFLLCK